MRMDSGYGFLCKGINILVSSATPNVRCPLSVVSVQQAIEQRTSLSIGRHGLSIVEPTCLGTFVRGGYNWPMAIHFLGAASAAGTSKYADFRDSRSVDFLGKLAGHLINAYLLSDPIVPPPFRISGTFIGLLVTRSLPELASNGPAGFGDQGIYPSQLQVIAVRNLLVSSLPE
jgi:hypothetical protein